MSYNAVGQITDYQPPGPGGVFDAFGATAGGWDWYALWIFAKPPFPKVQFSGWFYASLATARLVAAAGRMAVPDVLVDMERPISLDTDPYQWVPLQRGGIRVCPTRFSPDALCYYDTNQHVGWFYANGRTAREIALFFSNSVGQLTPLQPAGTFPPSPRNGAVNDRFGRPVL